MINDDKAARDWLETLPEYRGAAAKFDLLVAMLKCENAAQNLVSAASLANVWQRHIADSAQLLMHVPRETTTWLDLGTGAGFPGLVVAIVRPDLRITMVESRPRRATWLQSACAALDLPNAEVIASRLESVETRVFAAISARAFAPLQRLLSLSARFSDVRTVWLLPKGRSAAHELEQLTGWRHGFHVERSLTDQDAGIIVGRLGTNAERGT